MNSEFNIEETYRDACRICLKHSDNMKNLFNLVIPKDSSPAVDFIRKMSDLKLLHSENLPSNICSDCTQRVFETFDFVETCVASDARLRNLETRRMLRKIEAEALEQEMEEEIIVKCDIPTLVENISEDEITEKSEEKDNPLPPELQFTITRKINTYKCDNCNLKFTNKTKFLLHQRNHKNQPYKCSECSISYSKKYLLNLHLKSHTNEDKAFKCNVCGKQFNFEYLLKQHEFKHRDTKPFPCTKCDKGCLTAESLRRHMRTHDENYKKKVHICHLCNKSFAYPSFLAEHMKNHTGEKPHVCKECGKSFRQSGALHFHQKTHTGLKRFPCTICKEKFMARSILKVHMRKHTNERPYTCDICGVSFRQSSDLKSHRRIHTGEKLVLCTVCGKKLSTTGQLTIHLRSHTGEKPYVCHTCNKSFASKTMLVTHERIHTGERPYNCKICGKAFSQSCTLNTHLKTHNKKKAVKNSKGAVKSKEYFLGKDSGEATVTTLDSMLREHTQNEDFMLDDVVKMKTQDSPQFTIIIPATTNSHNVNDIMVEN
ncbi:unnamed protein product [Phyllotreta striolata]|uniref:Uncharacterized protein n=1 Tax=Phyllotreta striolata TaxID=444603 RepID=A0A9N9TVL4_PHYSR|nr:unnamed protein product [Phyllotreta striolata]